MPDIRERIRQKLIGCSATADFRLFALDFFKMLGYASDRHLPIGSVASFRSMLDPRGSLTEANALLSRWNSVHFLFQLTHENLAASSMRQGLLLKEDSLFDDKIIKSYVFFAIELAGSAPTRTELSLITRTINRLLPMPILVLFKHDSSLSLAIINRRKNLRDGTRDVLTRVSLIRDINLLTPHRAHLDLLTRFSLPELAAVSDEIRTFADLDNAWQKLLSVQELNNRFYRELVDWFTWATSEIKLAVLPDHMPDDETHRARATQEFTVRLICRTLFAWFLKEMHLIPQELLELYDASDRRRWLPTGNYDHDGNHYYRGILQNVFFQALNRPMNQRRKAGPEAANDRTVTTPELKKIAYLGKNLLPETFDYDLFDRIPYLNGGLFDDLPEDNAKDTIEDGAIRIPNKLFYACRQDGFTVACSTGRRVNNRPVEGLNRIFDRYRFTIAENTPLEEDVALDPELLGLVFENLLAEIDPDDGAAAATARKASGSYYTPRRIVDYMSNEALHLYLRTAFERQAASPDHLRLLSTLCYNASEATDFAPIAERVVAALDAVRVLDPACGSGAFPMGMLHRMVDLLRDVDPENTAWKRRLLSRLPAEVRGDAERGMAGKSYNYLRKLGLIQKNLYGVDIQPLAALIAKLRFFLTLVIEQDVNPDDRAHNYHLHALPNIETNLLCCNTLKEAQIGLFEDQAIRQYIAARERYYNPELSSSEREQLCHNIAATLDELFPNFTRESLDITPPRDAATARKQNIRNLQRWFRTASIPAPFFSARAFFPEIGDGGFHIVIGNPPYGGNPITDDIKDALGLSWKDPYGAFIARFLGDPQRSTPLAEGGVLAYIVSDTFMTIKSHRPLREQMMQNRIHKMLRVSGDTFNATVNCAVILCQRGAPSDDQICQMADLTNVSIYDQYERFLHLLYQTEGFSRRQNVSNQTYAIYHYRQSLIRTNSNLPFFVASPKLFALMNDTTAPVTHGVIGEKHVMYRTVNVNGCGVPVFKLGTLAHVPQGISTGQNEHYLRRREAGEGYSAVNQSEVLTQTELNNLSRDEQLNGVNPNNYEGRHFIPFDKGSETDTENNWLANYFVPTDYYIDWSQDSLRRMRTLTIADRKRECGQDSKIQPNDDQKLAAALRNQDQWFQPVISFSPTGQYSPTFRLGVGTVNQNTSSGIIVREISQSLLLAILASCFARYIFKNYLNHTVHTQEGDVVDFPFIDPELPQTQQMIRLVDAVLATQRSNTRYDYASNEQLEIDRLVHEAYGLNEADIREVEDWYARRYPLLAAALKRNLAAKRGQTVEEFAPPPVIHLYCDESRHLPHDRSPSLLLGLVSAPASEARALNHEISELWKSHGMPLHFEAKWTKVSPARLDFYRDLLDWFLAHDSLDFRALVLPDKQRMYSRLPEGARDHLYYRLYYQLLRSEIEPEYRYRAFLDIKDTRGRDKLSQLRQILVTDSDDACALQTLQHIHSHEVRLAQITDLLLGAVGFARAGSRAAGQPPPSAAKQALVNHLQSALGYPLTSDSPPGLGKLRIITWNDPDSLLL